MMKDYGGISAGRLEDLEERLKADVRAELGTFGGRLLLHTETSHGEVIPIWEEVITQDVAVLKDVMASERDVLVRFTRLPITAEHAPDMSDIAECALRRSKLELTV